MFNFLKRKPLKTAPGKVVSDDAPEYLEEQRLSEREPEADENISASNQFMRETAGLRGKIEVARRITPEQEAELHTTAERLGTEFNLDGNYQKFRELWAAEHGEQVFLAPVKAAIILRPDEQCCFCEPAVWGQKKGTGLDGTYSVFSNTFPLEKGASYRIGGQVHNHKALNEIKEIALGSLVITNQRLFFDGGSRSTTISFKRVLNVECYANGIEVSKTSEENDFFQMTPLSSEYAHMIIQEINRLS
jgi:hypothetical protein